MTDKKYPMVLMETFLRGKGIYNGCKSIDDMITHLSGTIGLLEDLQELDVKMEPSNDDYISLEKEVEENSEEFKQLEESGFIKIEFDEDGERIE